MRILVVNPNTNPATTRMMVEAARSALSTLAEEAVVTGVTAASGPGMIVDPEALVAAARPTVLAALAGVEEHRPDAVLVAAFGDPGARTLGDLLPVPVVGIGEAAVLAAAASGRRFAVVTTTGLLAESLDELVRRHCPEEADYAGLFLTNGDPEALAADPHRNVAALGGAVDDAVAAGCEVVVIGGGPLSDAARVLAERTDVQVIEPVPSAVALAVHRVSAAVTATTW